MTCPICFSEEFVTPIGMSHYICNNPSCNNNGKIVQFHSIEDDKVRFPYNQIFVNRKKSEFYRKPYLELSPVGINEII